MSTTEKHLKHKQRKMKFLNRTHLLRAREMGQTSDGRARDLSYSSLSCRNVECMSSECYVFQIVHSLITYQQVREEAHTLYLKSTLAPATVAQCCCHVAKLCNMIGLHPTVQQDKQLHGQVLSTYLVCKTKLVLWTALPPCWFCRKDPLQTETPKSAPQVRLLP